MPAQAIGWMAGIAGVAGLAFAGAAAAEPVSLEHDGLVLSGRYEPGPPGAPVVLMVHGTLAHADMEIMSTLREVFAEEGWGALAVSLSLGESQRTGMYPCDQVHRHRSVDAGKEALAWLGWLGEQGVERTVLLGHSRGALQMAEVAAGHPLSGVQAMVLIAPPLAEPGSGAAAYERRYGTTLETQLEKARERVSSGAPGDLISVPGFLHCEDASVSAESFLSYYGDTAPANLAGLIGGSPVPVLVIAGSEDEVAPGLPEAIEATTEPRVDVAEIEGADHFFRDLYAYDVVEAVQAFVAGLGAAASRAP